MANGDYTITIRGNGAFGGKDAKDAQRIVAQCVKSLKDAGQNVSTATFNANGQDQNMSDPTQYLGQGQSVAPTGHTP